MKVIVPLRYQTVPELLEVLETLPDSVDIAEVWLDTLLKDLLSNPSQVLDWSQKLATYKQERGWQFLAVCKTEAENGTFPGNQHEKITALQMALQLGFDWVDLDMSQNDLTAIKQIPSAKLWLSWHDFEDADSLACQEKFRSMQAIKPFLYKFAVTPKDENQLQNFVIWAKDLPASKVIFTTMGPHGVSGRRWLSSVSWGAFFAVSPGATTAPGQPSLDDLHF